MYEKPSSPQSVGQVLDGSFRLAAASFRDTWWLALSGALASSAALVYQFSRGGTFMEAMLAQPDAITWTLNIAGFVLSVMFYAAIFLRIDQIAAGTAAQGGAVSAALRRLPMLVVLWILLFVAIACGMILLVIPGIFLWIGLIAAMPIFLLENKGPISSFGSSLRLVWGNWWRTALIATVAGIIILVLYFIFAFVAGPVAAVLTNRDPVLTTVISTVLVFSLLGVLVTPYITALVLVIYWDLKLRKEGGDLAARV